MTSDKLGTGNAHGQRPRCWALFVRRSQLVARHSSFAVLAVLALSPASGQGPPPGTNLRHPIADAAIAESVAVLKSLEEHIQKNRKDAEAWHHAGRLAWLLMYRDRIQPYKGLDWTRLGRQADTSLRIASQLEPNNVRYRLSMGEFFLGTGQMAMRAQSYFHFDKAYDESRSSPDKQVRAEAAIEHARVLWRRYEDQAYRRMGFDFPPTMDCGQLIKDAGGPVQAYDRNLGGAARNDDSDYLRAEQLFRDAYADMPEDPRIFRQLAMAYAEKNRWKELAALAADRIRRLPKDPRGWFALGLAMQRQNERVRAEAVFDTALALSDPEERAHVTNLARLLSHHDSTSYASLPPAQSKHQTDLYWQFNDPLWSRGGDDARTEFLARGAYADIRWTVEELGYRGIDTDRGEFYIRWGPPDRVMQWAPGLPDMMERNGNSMTIDPLPVGGFTRPGAPNAGETDDKTSVTTMWMYEGCPVIVFRGMRTYATARIPMEGARTIDSMVRATPAMWRNALDIAVVDIPAQVARFRAGTDSVDAFIVVEPPIAMMREAAGANVPIRSSFWLFDRNRELARNDSTTLKPGTTWSWTYRLAPATYFYRVEATADGAAVAARTTSGIVAGKDTSGFSTRGYGISDPLIVAHVDEGARAQTWRDLKITPTASSIGENSEVGVVWENYDLGNIKGDAKYSVTLVFRRQYKAKLNQIRARIIGSMAAAVGVKRTEDQVIYTFDRSAPHAATIVDHISLNLADTPPGNYSITIGITDLATKKYVERTNRFTIR